MDIPMDLQQKHESESRRCRKQSKSSAVGGGVLHLGLLQGAAASSWRCRGPSFLVDREVRTAVADGPVEGASRRG